MAAVDVGAEDPPGLQQPAFVPLMSGQVAHVTSWLRDEDRVYAEQDEEQNLEQAERNAKMRDLLRQRRQQRRTAPEAAAPEDFMSIKASASGGASASSHAPSKGGGDGEPPESRPPWFVERRDMENTVLRLHEELLDFAEFMSHTKSELRARKRWVKTIATACRKLWPDCQVRIFGSFSTGLSLPNGDVDVAVLDVPDRPGHAMKMLADGLLASGEVSWLEMIESAKVPVVKLRQQASGLRADVVFNQPDGIETSRFIRDRCKEYPQMRPLLLFLKYFLLQRGLHETYTGGMGSYLLCNVVLHFLQRHPSRKKPRHYAATTLGHLLFDFLKYYGQEFQYDTKGISVLEGGYTFNKAARGWHGGNRRGGGLQLCLESPLGHGVDLGGPCFRIAILRNLFLHALHCLSHLFVTRAGPEASLICPLLLDPNHPVIATRHSLMAEQPVALPGLPRSSSRLLEEEGGTSAAADRDDREDEADACSDYAPGDEDGAGEEASTDAHPPAAKRPRRATVPRL